MTFFLTFFQMENIDRHLEQGKNCSPILVLHCIRCTVHLSWKYFACSSMHSMLFWIKNCKFENRFLCKKHKFFGKSGLYDVIPLNCGHLDQNYYFEKASVRYFDSVQRKSRITVKWRCCNFRELFYALNYHI